MMRFLLVACALFAVAACTPNAGGDPAGRSDTRQQPTNLEPGIHIGGHVNVGVVHTF